MDKKGMRRLQLLPLNQVANLKLREAGMTADPETQAVFQLMGWGLANGVHAGHGRAGRELLRLRYLADQQAALDYLLTRVPGGLTQLEKRLLHLPPRVVAGKLLELLDSRFMTQPFDPSPGGMPDP